MDSTELDWTGLDWTVGTFEIGRYFLVGLVCNKYTYLPKMSLTVEGQWSMSVSWLSTWVGVSA